MDKIKLSVIGVIILAVFGLGFYILNLNNKYTNVNNRYNQLLKQPPKYIRGVERIIERVDTVFVQTKQKKVAKVEKNTLSAHFDTTIVQKKDTLRISSDVTTGLGTRTIELLQNIEWKPVEIMRTDTVYAIRVDSVEVAKDPPFYKKFMFGFISGMTTVILILKYIAGIL